MKPQVDGLELRAKEQKAYGVSENHIVQCQTQSVSNSLGQEDVKAQANPKNSYRWQKKSLCYTECFLLCQDTQSKAALPTGKRSISAMS